MKSMVYGIHSSQENFKNYIRILVIFTVLSKLILVAFIFNLMSHPVIFDELPII